MKTTRYVFLAVIVMCFNSCGSIKQMERYGLLKKQKQDYPLAHPILAAPKKDSGTMPIVILTPGYSQKELDNAVKDSKKAYITLNELKEQQASFEIAFKGFEKKENESLEQLANTNQLQAKTIESTNEALVNQTVRTREWRARAEQARLTAEYVKADALKREQQKNAEIKKLQDSIENGTIKRIFDLATDALIAMIVSFGLLLLFIKWVFTKVKKVGYSTGQIC